jgi:transglutaminase-like putative cysteine protease
MKGMHNLKDIEMLQDWLNGHGFNAGPTDGYFGEKTKGAVIRFQQAYNNKYDPNIKVDGVVCDGGETRKAMARFGQQGPSPAPVSQPSVLELYLLPTKHCECNDPRIKQLAEELTVGAKNVREKAERIFNFVLTQKDYFFYYKTRFGAIGMLTSKIGNCVDMAHLLNALFRAVKIPARYHYGTCKFTSGHWIAHIWSEVYVDGKWLKADATNNANGLGVVKNWNVNNYTNHGTFKEW